MSRPLLFVGAAVAGLVLSGCGKTGELERPGPLFGAGAATRQADEAQRQAQDPSRPVNTVNPRDLSADPAPPRAAPIPGTSDPARMPPQGAIPNPYANPR